MESLQEHLAKPVIFLFRSLVQAQSQSEIKKKYPITNTHSS